MNRFKTSELEEREYYYCCYQLIINRNIYHWLVREIIGQLERATTLKEFRENNKQYLVLQKRVVNFVYGEIIGRAEVPSKNSLFSLLASFFTLG